MDVSKKTALVMAGGTGGHVFPALAVAHVLQSRGWDVQWLGTQAGIEARVVPDNGIPLHTISSVGLRGKGVGQLLVAPFFLLRALWQAMVLLLRLKPAVVLGMGGFASGPGGLAAWLLRRPLVIHEQNAIAGTTNRLLSRIATRVLSAFPCVFAGGVQTGNPVRAGIAALAAQAKQVSVRERPLKLLVLGGSQGARVLNEIVPAAIAKMPVSLRPQVFHQAGRNMLDETRAAYRDAGVNAEVEAFVDDMASRYQWADFAVCRSGAMTVSELACAQLPALLVPFPHAIDDHQTHNAQWLVKAGAACLQPQSGMTADNLAALLESMVADRSRVQAMADALRAVAHSDATARVADICEEISRV